MTLQFCSGVIDFKPLIGCQTISLYKEYAENLVLNSLKPVEYLLFWKDTSKGSGLLLYTEVSVTEKS